MAEITKRKISSLTKLPDNPRNIRAEDMAVLVDSLARNPELFDARPIILSDRTGELVIIAGNMRFEAAKSLGMKEVPTILLPGLTEAKEREIAIRDNINNGDWDWDILANQWDDLPLGDWGLEMPSFDAIEDEPTESPTEDEEAVAETISKAAELQQKWQTATGQIWKLGEHRLMCGDSTIPEMVNQLLNGNIPNLMITDPPYGVEYDANWRNEFAEKGLIDSGCRSVAVVYNDDRVDWSAAYALFPGNVFYCWHAGFFASEVQASIEIAGFEIRSQIIWGKPSFAISRGHYNWQTEPCWYAVRKGKTASWIGGHSQSNLWSINREPHSKGGHSTQKPIECMLKPIKNHEGDVYEPFSGSGTTLIAAEQAKRKCYAMELAPEYVAVTLERWHLLTGKAPELIDG